MVGSAPAYTSRPAHASSCYLVEHGSTVVALDFGQGAFSELWRYRSPGTLDAVVISHLHADHCVGLVPLRHWVKYENNGRGPALHGPAELRARFDAFQAEADFLADLAGPQLATGAFAVGDLTIEAGRVTHIPDSFAFRVAPTAGGPGIVYSGDCGVADDLLPLIKPGDTLLCEAALGLGGIGGGPHLTVYEAANAAVEGRAVRLVLTHILDGSGGDDLVSLAMRRFDGEVLMARPGLSVGDSTHEQ